MASYEQHKIDAATSALRLYGIVGRGCYASGGRKLQPGDWTLWETASRGWRMVALWRSEPERDVGLAAMGLAVRKGSVRETVDLRMVEAGLEEL